VWAREFTVNLEVYGFTTLPFLSLMNSIEASVTNPVATPINELIRVFLFEATQMSCELVSHVLEKSKYGLTVVGSGVSLGGKGEFQSGECDVVVISSALKDGPRSGFTLLRSLAKTNRSTRSVMLLDQGNRDLVVEAFRYGAAGVCERDQPYEMLCKCVYSVSCGQVWANSQQLKFVMEALASGMVGRTTDVKRQILLTRREDEICSLVAEGLKNREIGQVLSLSEHMVKNHLFRIFERLSISSRTELILYVLAQRDAPAHENQDPLIAPLQWVVDAGAGILSGVEATRQKDPAD
jgi:DNA-binding NarL/FixJ family response regulator